MSEDLFQTLGNILKPENMETVNINTQLWYRCDYIGTIKEFDLSNEKIIAQLIDSNDTIGEEEVKPCLVLGKSKDIVNQRTDLIVTAVNACKQVNPANPLAVAKVLPELFEALQSYVDSMLEKDEQEKWFNKYKNDSTANRILCAAISALKQATE